MKNPYIRKIVLLSCIAVLLCIYIVQLSLSSRTGIKSLPLESEIDVLTVQAASFEVRLSLKDGRWFVSRGEGQTDYEAARSIVDGMLSDIKELKLLATASRSVGTDSARYGLDDGSKIVVTAYSGGNPVRTLHVGKATSTNSQNYVQLDDDGAVYIVGAALHRDFDKQCDEIRSKSIYSLGDDEKIEKISYVSYLDENATTLAFLKEKAETDATDTDEESVSVSKAVWKLVAGQLEDSKEVDSDKVSNWVSSLSMLSASEWLDDNATIPEGYELESELSFTAGTKNCTTKLYSGKEGEEESYIVSCSETPYLFKVASYVANRYKKNTSDFVK
ncbi:MAG: DUF4340 domain-containing protein [Treponema sp.]|nr:DUF4340 domain-containing protein [Treponema sp.]